LRRHAQPHVRPQAQLHAPLEVPPGAGRSCAVSEQPTAREQNVSETG